MKEGLQQHLAASSELARITMETVLDNIPTYIYVMNPITGQIIFANRSFYADFPGTVREGLSRSELHEKILLNCKDCPHFGKDLTLIKPHYFELEFKNPEQWLGVQCSPLRWLDGSSARLFSCQDISEKKLHERYVQSVSFTDMLTGLPNRRQCEIDLDETKNREGSYLLYMDLDDFKIVNEGYGHEYGDQLLVLFSRYISGIFGKHRIYRFDGDEFAVIIEDSNLEVEALLEKLLRRTKRVWKVLDRSFYCSISLGIVRGLGAESAKVILKNADVAMFEAKKTGKNHYLYYNKNMHDSITRRAHLEMMLRDAINSDFDGFVIYFQPYVNTQTTRMSGAEALVRWFARGGEPIMPEEFISLSEYLGLIVPLGDFILRESVKTLKYINDNIDPKFMISVNFSIRQLQQPDIIRRVENILEEVDVDPKNLVFEVTESMASTELERLQTICEGFRRKGIKIAMDDFGTGYSSLGNLRTLPLDIIKIDRCFIQDITDDEYSNSFIKLISNLGHSINKKICIEGVETEAQTSYCIDAQADIIQGFYFYRPMAEAEFLAAVEKDRKALHK